MPRFRYRAVSPGGEVTEGELEAPDRAGLVAQLRKRGLMLLHSESRGAKLKAVRHAGPRRRRSKHGMSAEDVALFTRELTTLLKAGLPLDQALSATAQQAQKPATAAVAQDILEHVRGGSSFADALAEHGESFPKHYIGLVRAGEAGGTLGEVMANLAESEERARSIRQEIRSSLNYPILVLVAAVVSVVILLIGVIPEFEPLLADAGDALPPSAAAVLWVSQTFRDYWWAIPVLILAAALGARRIAADPAARARFDAALLRLPQIGTLVRKLEAARFCRTLGTLLANGVDVVPALDMASDTLTNAKLARDVADAGPRLRRGEGLADPLADAEVFPPLALRLVRVGESSGELDTMLLTVARIYEEETRRDTAKLLSLLVPVVTLVLGVVVAGIIGSILSAILTSYDLPM